MIESMTYGKASLMEFALGPSVSDALDVTYSLWNIGSPGSRRALKRRVIRSIPYVGKTVAARTKPARGGYGGYQAYRGF